MHDPCKRIQEYGKTKGPAVRPRISWGTLMEKRFPEGEGRRGRRGRRGRFGTGENQRSGISPFRQLFRYSDGETLNRAVKSLEK